MVETYEPSLLDRNSEMFSHENRFYQFPKGETFDCFVFCVLCFVFCIDGRYENPSVWPEGSQYILQRILDSTTISE
jgi:hypothetical protein